MIHAGTPQKRFVLTKYNEMLDGGQLKQATLKPGVNDHREATKASITNFRLQKAVVLVSSASVTNILCYLNNLALGSNNPAAVNVENLSGHPIASARAQQQQRAYKLVGGALRTQRYD